jgi:hypothetical protein
MGGIFSFTYSGPRFVSNGNDELAALKEPFNYDG